MSVLNSKKTPESTVSWKNIAIPLYILLSSIFIIFVAYNYFQSVVYNTGLNQGAAAGQQQGYEQAIIDLMNQTGTQCDPVALTAGDAQVDVINVACLQIQEQPNVSGELN